MHKIYYKDFISVIILNKIIIKAVTNFFFQSFRIFAHKIIFFIINKTKKIIYFFIVFYFFDLARISYINVICKYIILFLLLTLPKLTIIFKKFLTLRALSYKLRLLSFLI